MTLGPIPKPEYKNQY